MAYSRYATEMKDGDNNIYGLMDEEAREQLSDLKSAFKDSFYQLLEETIPTSEGETTIAVFEFDVLANQTYLLTISNTDTSVTITTKDTSAGKTKETLISNIAGQYIITPEYDAKYIRFLSSKGATIKIETITAKDNYIDIKRLKAFTGSLYKIVSETYVTTESTLLKSIPYDIFAGQSFLITVVLNSPYSIFSLYTRETSSGENIETIKSLSPSIRNYLFTASNDAKMFVYNSAVGATVTISSLAPIDGYTYAKTIDTQAKADLSLNDQFDQTGSYTTNQGVGQTASSTTSPSANLIGLKVPCVIGDVFNISGHGGTTARLWCLTDSSYKIIAVANRSVTETNLDVTAYADGYFICNVYKADPYQITKKNGQLKTQDLQKQIDGIESIVDSHTDSIDVINKTILADDNLNDYFSDGYITTNGSVGATVALTKTPSANFVSAVFACKKDDVFTITGEGGSNGRLWCFTDGNYKKISAASSSATETNKTLTADEDGFLIINIKKPSFNVTKKELWIDVINHEYRTSKLYDPVTITSINRNKRIDTNTGIGQIISTNTVDSPSMNSFILSVTANDEFRLFGVGGNNARLWCLTDTNYVCQSVSGTNASALETPEHFKAPVNGYLIINYYYANDFILLKRRNANSIQTIENNYQNIAKAKDDIVHLEDFTADVQNIPLVQFNLNDYQLKDVSDYRELVDYDSGSRPPMLEQFYGLFDSLVTNYPDYVSRVDAAELVDLSYPVYANGVQGSSTYEDTPAYKTYMYKLIDTNLGAGNGTKNVKRKMLLNCAIHGNETMTPFNAFVFASELCKSIDPNYFKLRAAFDIYIIPCLNGYGMYHNQRPNADWIDINRNFPTIDWHVADADKIGNKNLCTYTGETAGSTFECQLIMALKELLNPEIVIDHHNYSGGDGQFYTNVVNDLYLRLTHQSMIDCSIAFTKGLPEYFGSDYKLMVPNRNTTYAPRQTTDNRNGKMHVWLAENGTLFSSAVEIASDIRFLNGVNTQTYNDWAGSDTFSVAEYTLRNQVLLYGNYVLSKDRIN